MSAAKHVQLLLSCEPATQVKVAEFDVCSGIHQDVLWLWVSVCNSLLMVVVHHECGLTEHSLGLLLLHANSLQDGDQQLSPTHLLPLDVDVFSGFSHLKQLDHIWVPQSPLYPYNEYNEGEVLLCLDSTFIATSVPVRIWQASFTWAKLPLSHVPQDMDIMAHEDTLKGGAELSHLFLH